MLRFKQNMQVANVVLATINLLIRSRREVDVLCEKFHVEAYSNGREQGYHIVGFSLTTPSGNLGISFSEHRGTDQIVVYHGELVNFFMQGNYIDDEKLAGDNSKFFANGRHAAAAQYIIDLMAKAI